MTAPCPCGRSLINATNAIKAIKATKASKNQRLPFAACCGPYLNEGAATLAVDAETLMRSRYSAFVLGRRDYLLATWHASTRPANLALDFAAKWLGLEVLAYTTLDDDNAEVEFVARYREGGRAVRLHEYSRFVREQGRWYYLNGDLS